MHDSVRAFVKRQTKGFTEGRVLEVGAMDINGGVRDLFPDADYLGIDLAEGPGVDRVCSAHRLVDEFGADAFDLVLCLEVLEHDQAPWVTVGQLATVVKPGGRVLVTARGNGFPEHNRPDRWRFMRDGIVELFTGTDLKPRVTPDPQVSGWLVAATRKAADHG